MTDSLQRPAGHRGRPDARPDGDSAPAFRVRAPTDLLALIPYLLGFHPRSSVVIVLLEAGQVALTARMDLVPVDQVEGLHAEIRRLADHVAADSWVVVGYGDRPAAGLDAGGDPGRDLLAALAERSGPEVREVLWVQDGLWWGLLCAGDCCPPEGRVHDPGCHPLAAEAVLAGRSAVADRAELAAMVAGPSVGAQQRLTARVRVLSRGLTGTRRSRQRRMLHLIEHLVGAERSPTEDESLQLALLARDVMVRDVAWALMSREQALQHVALWQAVCAQAPDAVSSAPICLLGIAAWLAGNGALLNCCIDRIEEVNPGYSMGEICRDISVRAVPPYVWDELAVEMRNDPDLLVG